MGPLFISATVEALFSLSSMRGKQQLSCPVAVDFYRGGPVTGHRHAVSVWPTVEATNFKFGIQLGLGEELTKKQLLGPKLAGVRAKGASKKLGPPYFFVIFCSFRCVIRR